MPLRPNNTGEFWKGWKDLLHVLPFTLQTSWQPWGLCFVIPFASGCFLSLQPFDKPVGTQCLGWWVGLSCDHSHSHRSKCACIGMPLCCLSNIGKRFSRGEVGISLFPRSVPSDLGSYQGRLSFRDHPHLEVPGGLWSRKRVFQDVWWWCFHANSI